MGGMCVCGVNMNHDAVKKIFPGPAGKHILTAAYHPPDTQWGHSNDHNSAVIRATELIPGVVYTSRLARNL